MRKITVIMLVLSLMVSLNVFAFEFEGYKWGTPMAKMKKILEEKNKAPVPLDSGRGLTYNDVIVGAPCVISLYFTPMTKLLAYIQVAWSATDIGADVRELIQRRNGVPYYYGDLKLRDFNTQFRWGQATGERIMLDYRYQQTLLSANFT